MSLPDAVSALERQDWTEPLDKALDSALRSTLDSDNPPAQTLRNLLHGVWLGHPLHPALTDVPVGAWTAACAMDALDCARGTDEFAKGADAAIVVGLAGAAASAVTGIADWHQTDGGARKIGMVHGLLNLSATALYATSLLLRRRGRRGAGRGLAFAAYAGVLVSAYLGGHLVYNQRIGTDHATLEEPPDEWIPVLADEELPEAQPMRVEAGKTPVLLVRLVDRICAMAETCSHLGGPLAEGKLDVERGFIQCPWHSSRYALEDGRVIDGPSAFPQPCFEARVRDGQIELRLGSRRGKDEG